MVAVRQNTQIGAFYGNMNYHAVAKMVKRTGESRVSDKKLNNTIALLEKKVNV